VTLGNRAELRDVLAPDAELRDRWAARGADLLAVVQSEGLAVQELVDGWVKSGGDPDDDGAARVLDAVTRLEVRDAALYAVSPDTAGDHLRVWIQLLRGACDPQVPDVAAVTAFCAWLSGHGALAWCALDRCFAVDGDHLLGTCLAECLTRALPPTAWEEVVGAAGPTQAGDCLPTPSALPSGLKRALG
jgi:hypothetical protein